MGRSFYVFSASLVAGFRANQGNAEDAAICCICAVTTVIIDILYGYYDNISGYAAFLKLPQCHS